MLTPLGAVVAAFAVAFVAGGILLATGLDEDSAGAVAIVGASVLLLAFAVLLWRNLPEPERRRGVALLGPARGAIGWGLGFGLLIVIGAAAIIAIGAEIDPVVERRLEDLDRETGTAPWQLTLLVVALVVLAPLGEELLFRVLLLRGLMTRMRFWFAAPLSAVLFAAAHADAYVLWPRAIGLVATGVVLAWVYRRRGYWASVTAHATVNLIAAVAILATV